MATTKTIRLNVNTATELADLLDNTATYIIEGRRISKAWQNDLRRKALNLRQNIDIQADENVTCSCAHEVPAGR